MATTSVLSDPTVAAAAAAVVADLIQRFHRDPQGRNQALSREIGVTLVDSPNNHAQSSGSSKVD